MPLLESIPFEIVSLVTIVLLIVVILTLFKFRGKFNEATKQLDIYKVKFSDIFDKESELLKLNIEITDKNTEIEELRESYKNKRVVFDHLLVQAAIYDETIELAELGFYKPSFSFDQSEKFKEEISKAKAHQKQMVNEKTAVYCNTEWEVSGSKAKGRTMTNRNIRLTARAFNNECDASIGKVKWNNVVRMQERISKAFTAINKLNESNNIYIAKAYLDLKLRELALTHEFHEKKQQEKEEQSEIRLQMREEERLEKEMANAIKEEDKYEKLLSKAKLQAEKSSGDKFDKLQAEIEKLSSELEEAHSKTERAKSMAEQTKAGHVYVISNVGSFGENVYKIGMTRRLEPLDRVKELGDASVPFTFDVHAMIYTENAPELEKSLHKEFNNKRLNLVNNRKEFFNVELNEIERIVTTKHGEADFYITAEARQYHESLAIRAQRKENIENQPQEFPAEI